MSAGGNETPSKVLDQLSKLISEGSAVDFEREVKRLSLALKNAEGKFALFFSVCNSRLVEDFVTEELLRATGGHELEIKPEKLGEAGLYGLLEGAPGSATDKVLIVHGLHQLLPTSAHRAVEKGEVLRELQLQRERFRKLGRPVLFWMPEYVYSLIGQRAIDFWSWQTGGHFFPEQLPNTTVVSSIASAGSVNIAVSSGSTVNVGASSSSGSHGEARTTAVNRAENSALEGLQNSSSANDLPPSFIGREALVSEIESLLKDPTKNGVVVSGMWGTGKSTLARYLAAKLRNEFDGNVVIVSGRNLDPKTAMKDVIVRLGASPRIADDELTLRATYHKMLSGRRSLIVFDDVTDVQNVRGIIPDRSSKVIVTTRNNSEALKNLNAIRLGVLTTEEAVTLLRSYIESEGLQDQELLQLASLAGFLPLNLAIIGGLLRSNPGLGVEDLVRGLSKKIDQSDNSEHSSLLLSETLEYAFAEVAKRTVLEPKNWTRLSVFEESFSTEAAHFMILDQGPVVSSELRLEYLLGVLVDHALLYFDSSNERYMMHHAVKLWAKEKLLATDDWHAAKLAHARYYSGVLANAEQLYRLGGSSETEGLAVFDRESTDILAALQFVNSIDSGDGTAADIQSSFASSAGRIFELRVDPNERTKLFELTLNAEPVTSHTTESVRSLVGLADAEMASANLRKALQHLDQALGVADQDKQLADILTRRAQINIQLGKVLDAEKDVSSSLMISEASGDQANIMLNLSLIGRIQVIQGQLEEAVKSLKRAAEIGEELGSPSARGETLFQLGRLYTQRGEYEIAQEVLSQALAISRSHGNTRLQSHILSDLGLLVENTGDLVEAKHLLEEALSIARSNDDLVEVSNVLGLLGATSLKEEDLVKAGRYFEEQRELSERVFGLEHIRTGEAIGNLGLVRQRLGDLEAAKEAYERALEIDKLALGEQHLNLSIHHNNLGNVAFAQGDVEGALNSLFKALEIARSTLGENHPRTGTLLQNISLVLEAAGAYSEAEVLMQKAVEVFQTVLGTEHKETQRAVDFLERLKRNSAS